MKREMILMFIIALAIAPALVSAELTVDKVDKGSIIIAEINNPAVFDFIVNNSYGDQEISIYSLVGVEINPNYPFKISSGTTTFEVKFYPTESMRKQPGFLNFEYQIKGEKSGIFSDKIRLKIVPLKNALSFSAERLHLSDNESVVIIKNTQNAYLNDFSINLHSSFFNYKTKVSLSPYEVVSIKVPFDYEEVKTLQAGSYIFTADVGLENAKEKFEGVVYYVEQENVLVTSKDSGFIIRKSEIVKSNEGNIPVDVKIEMKKDIISRLFNVFSIDPLKSERKGFFVYYTWERELTPSSSFTVSSTTNYTMPLIILILIIAIASFVSISMRTNVTLSKRVSFVKTKGGEFALKVRLHVKAKNYVERVQVIDRLPGMTVLYEKFGIRPDKIESASRKLIWNIERLNAGEERVYSYIVYSKVNVVGRFELPSAVAIFEKDGKTQEAMSNKTYFVAETNKSDY